MSLWRRSWIAFGLAFGAELGAQAPVAVSGTVVDSATRQGVAGAIISAATSDRLVSTRSDEAGKFTLRGLNPDQARIAVRRIGYRQQEWSVEVNADTSVTLTIVPNGVRLAPVRVGAKGEGVWGVIVRASDFAPIAGAKVFVAGSGMPVITDSAGEYFVPLKRPGTFMVRVTQKGFAEDILPVKVKRDEVVESSHVLEESDRAGVLPGLWLDFDKRLRWAPTNNSALVTGADLRAAGGTTSDALRMSPEFVRTAIRLVSPPRGICVFVNGIPRPLMDIDDIRPEEIRAMEVYSNVGKDQMVIELGKMWPSGAYCGSGGAKGGASNRQVGSMPVVKWAVIWTR
jgi:hypothetical protein